MPKLTVYMIGLMYFSGCDEPEMVVYVPDGTSAERAAELGIPQHFASLWIKADHVNAGATNWAETLPRQIPGVSEFRIGQDCEVAFPDGNESLNCKPLDAVMPKLKKDDDAEPFEVDPENAETIATVTIHGGTLDPFDVKKNPNKYFGVVRWTIANPSGLQITDGEQTVTLRGDVAAEVVFSNIHQPVLGPNGKDSVAGDHIALFKQLNPEYENATLISHKPGNPPNLKTNNQVINSLEGIAHTCGVTPPCCALVQHN